MLHHGDFDYSKVTIYIVGGAVRDYFLGVESKDKDYVVVGSSPSEMLNLGFKQVGTDFPVFLHPLTQDEYALARTERKIGEGYSGFDCDWEGVTIEEDLSRRDLTINSIAWDCSRNLGHVIDPFHGLQDIKDKVLRHTTEAFSEDPLRILRVARFLSRFGEDWCVAEETRLLCYSMAISGSLYELKPERVWLEVEKVLKHKQPSVFFDWLLFAPMFDDVYWLIQTGQRLDHHPEGDVWTHTALVMDYAGKTFEDPEVTFAAFTHDFGKPVCWEKYGNAHGHELEGLVYIEDFCNRWRVPNSYKALALMTCKQHTKVHGILGRNAQAMTRPKSIMKLFEETSALAKPERFLKMLKVCESDAKGRGRTLEQVEEFENKPYPQRQYLVDCLNAALQLDTKSISTKMLDE